MQRAREGERVRGNYNSAGNWLPGSIETAHEGGTYDIMYDSGKFDLGVAAENVLRGDGTKPGAQLAPLAKSEWGVAFSARAGGEWGVNIEVGFSVHILLGHGYIR